MLPVLCSYLFLIMLGKDVGICSTEYRVHLHTPTQIDHRSRSGGGFGQKGRNKGTNSKKVHLKLRDSWGKVCSYLEKRGRNTGNKVGTQLWRPRGRVGVHCSRALSRISRGYFEMATRTKSRGNAKSTQLRWEAFCREYMIDKDAARAAGAAGYAPTSQSGSAMLRKPWIRERIRQLAKAHSERLELRADDVLKEIARVAMKKVATKGTEKMKALELLAKHFRLLEPEQGPVQVSAGAVQVVIQAVGVGALGASVPGQIEAVPGQLAMGPPSDEKGGPTTVGGHAPHGQGAATLGEGKEHPQIGQPPTPLSTQPPTPLSTPTPSISKSPDDPLDLISNSDEGAPSK